MLFFLQVWYFAFQNALNTVVLKDMRSNRDNVSQAVLAVEVQHKESKLHVHSVHTRRLQMALVKFDIKVKFNITMCGRVGMWE